MMAQITQTAVEVEPWLKVLFWLAGGTFAVVKVFQAFSPKPPTAELDKSLGSLSARVAELEKVSLDGVERRRLIHERITKLSEDTSEHLQEVCACFDEKIGSCHKRIDDLPRQMQAIVTQCAALAADNGTTRERLGVIETDIKTLLRRVP